MGFIAAFWILGFCVISVLTKNNLLAFIAPPVILGGLLLILVVGGWVNKGVHDQIEEFTKHSR